jgi:hypothetical protein
MLKAPPILASTIKVKMQPHIYNKFTRVEIGIRSGRRGPGLPTL